MEPLLNLSSVVVGSGLVTFGGPFSVLPVNDTTLQINFGIIQNLPGASNEDDSIELFVKFKTANKPLILSGRRQFLKAMIIYSGGSQVAVKEFMIVGPLVKPLLTILKRTEVSEVHL